MRKDLSILIPLFNDLSFLKALLKKISNTREANYEVIIYDDSSNNQAESYIRTINLPKNVIYKKNNPSKGAVKNWNYLLNSANGKYLWLLHQNDMPGSIESILKGLVQDTDYDAYIIPSFVESYIFNTFKTEHKHTVKRLLIKILNNPKLIFGLNIIGSPSSIIIKKDYYEDFDAALKWQVDTENYYRLISKNAKIKFLDDCEITSYYNSNSITSQLRDISKINSDEIEFIQNKHQITFNVYDKILIKYYVIMHKIYNLCTLKVK